MQQERRLQQWKLRGSKKSKQSDENEHELKRKFNEALEEQKLKQKFNEAFEVRKKIAEANRKMAATNESLRKNIAVEKLIQGLCAKVESLASDKGGQMEFLKGLIADREAILQSVKSQLQQAQAKCEGLVAVTNELEAINEQLCLNIKSAELDIEVIPVVKDEFDRLKKLVAEYDDSQAMDSQRGYRQQLQASGGGEPGGRGG